MIDKKQPIVVKKIVKGGHGHHGGAWKVAFADFATAMMAFFLLLWLMGGTSDEERAAVSEYFNNPSMSPGSSTVAPAASGPGPGGASTSMIEMGGAMNLYTEPPTFQELKEEKEQLDNLMEKLKEAIESTPSLEQYKDQLMLDITSEGLRIQIVDKENRPMFDSGEAHLKYHTYEILIELAKFINQAPNPISISGHTDASPFNKEDYSNWELSADRANTARRALIDGELASNKIGRVIGLADSVLFDVNNPRAAVNRRISILLLNKKTAQAISKSEGVTEKIKRERADLFDQPLPEPGDLTFNVIPTEPESGPEPKPELKPEPISVSVPKVAPPNLIQGDEMEELGPAELKLMPEGTQPEPKQEEPPQPAADEPFIDDGDLLDVPMEYL
ncbi:flagellar motor protein MotB [Pseudomonadota bacterium]